MGYFYYTDDEYIFFHCKILVCEIVACFFLSYFFFLHFNILMFKSRVLIASHSFVHVPLFVFKVSALYRYRRSNQSNPHNLICIFFPFFWLLSPKNNTSTEVSQKTSFCFLSLYMQNLKTAIFFRADNNFLQNIVIFK